MTLLMVVGAGGMTGWELAKRAPASGFECLALDRSQLDITDSDRVEEVIGASRPDVVVNAAAYTAVDKAELESATAMRINGDGAGNLARSAEKNGSAMLQISTDYVFDGAGSTPYAPDDQPNPVGSYGRSKLAGERAVESMAQRHAIVRTSWVFSHRGHNFVRTMLRKLSDGQTLKVVNDQSGRPTAAGDLADALLRVARALHDDRTLAGTWHFANAGVTTWYDFARTIFELRGSADVPVEPVPTSAYRTDAQRPAYSVLDTSSFETTFGYIPRHWRDSLRETLEQIS